MQSAFSNLQSLYNSKKDAQGKWKTWIVIYDKPNCSDQASGAISIVGFTPATITSVNASTVSATVNCNVVQSGAGSGEQFGALGSVPSLVE